MPNRRRTPLEIEEIKADSCSRDLRLSILHNLPFFRGLSHEDVFNINKLFNDVHYPADGAIYYAGDKANRFCVIASGSVKLMKNSAEGHAALIDILRQGEFFGSLESFGDTVHQETAIAQTSVCILKINSENFRDILNKYPACALKVLDIVAKRLSDAQEMIRQLSASSIESRIVYTLLKLSEKLGEQKEVGLLIQIPLSRNDIAEMTGTTPETASRIMSQLQREGIIKTGRKWIAIKDVRKLKELSLSE